eukprot:3710983-Pleurochrysis_carterae.AAC.1
MAMLFKIYMFDYSYLSPHINMQLAALHAAEHVMRATVHFLDLVDDGVLTTFCCLLNVRFCSLQMLYANTLLSIFYPR